MLSSKNRLNKKEFNAVLKNGKSHKEGFLILKAAPQKSGEIRCGFTVSRKVSKKATIRNKIKRRLSSIVKSKMGEVKPGIYIVFIALSGIEKKDFQGMEETIDKLFKRAKIYDISR